MVSSSSADKVTMRVNRNVTDVSAVEDGNSCKATSIDHF